MSIYGELLVAALAEPSQLTPEATTGEWLAEVLWRRSRLDERRPDTQGSWTASALADQLAYDVALVRLARHLGVASDVRAFAGPSAERLRLEAELAARGIALADLSGQTRSATQGR